MGRLTALAVRNTKEPGRYHDGDGLMLVVKPTGAKSWILRQQVNGKRRDIGLGSAKVVSLAEARQRAAATRKVYMEGGDPIAIRQAARNEVARMPTFEEAARTAHGELKAGWRNPKHAAQWISTLERYVFPDLGKIPVDAVTGPMVRDVLLSIWLDKPETARRIRQRIGVVLDWAYSKGLRDAEAPMRSISKGLPRQPKTENHFAALSYEDLPKLMHDLSETDAMGRLALRFTILTAARSGETRHACWSEVDLKKQLWTVPALKMKAGKEHMVPLSDGALEVLRIVQPLKKGLKDELIFPGSTLKPLSDMTLTKTLRDRGYDSVTVHGFRSTFRDWAAERTDYPSEVVETALAHTIKNRVEAAYRRTNYLEKRRNLMQDWSDYCVRAIAGVDV